MSGNSDMVRELSPCCELLERRLALMRGLANSLKQVQAAVVHSDLGGIEGHTLRQRELCDALRQLEAEALAGSPQNPMGGERRKQKSWAGSAQDAVSPPVRQRWEALDQELIEVEMKVSQLNRVYGALLRRAQRTLQIFMRLRASSANTYTPPKGARAPSPLQEASHV
jgi:hypothetical protein